MSSSNTNIIDKQCKNIECLKFLQICKDSINQSPSTLYLLIASGIFFVICDKFIFPSLIINIVTNFNITHIYKWGLYYAGLLIARGMVYTFTENSIFKFNYILNGILYKNLLKTIHSTYLYNIGKIDNAIILSYYEKFKKCINEFIISGKYYKLSTILFVIGLFFYIIYYNPKLALIYIISVIIFISLCILFLKISNKESIAIEEKASKYTTQYSDVLFNNQSLFSNNMFQHEIDKLDTQNNDIVSLYNKNIIKSSWLRLGLYVSTTIIASIVLYFSYNSPISIDIKKRIFIFLCIVYLDLINVSSFIMPTLVSKSEYDSILLSLHNIYNMNKSDIIAQDNINNKLLYINDGFIELRNVSVKIKDKLILNNINATFMPNEIVAITGGIGSGKSTLIKAIMLYQPYTGQILIDNTDIKNYKVDFYRNKISYCPQHPVLFNRSIKDNIIYGTSKSNHEIHQFFIKYNVYDIFAHLPKKLDTIAGQYGNNLSGGQKQIVYLLRNLLKDNKIILLDEPTSALDSHTKKYIISIIKQIKNKTILIVSHDTDLIKECSRIIVMDKGSIVSI